MKKKKVIICVLLLLLVCAFIALWVFHRHMGGEGRIIKIEANEDKGFSTEYYLYIPDTLKQPDDSFLLVEGNNTGFVDDSHEKHVEAAYHTIGSGQAHYFAKDLGVPLLIPCFDRPETDWELYTHALDRDTLLNHEGSLNRIDRQLIAMITDARAVLAEKNIKVKDKVLLNGFSASGSFANRFTCLYPELVAGVAAGGVNGMAILPLEQWNDRKLIYPVGVSDLMEVAGLKFNLLEFALVPQYYYMGGNDENDALPYDDAYSDLERELVSEVLEEDMDIRWEKCKQIYESQGIQAEFHTYQGIGHETTEEVNADIVAFFLKVMEEYK